MRRKQCSNGFWTQQTHASYSKTNKWNAHDLSWLDFGFLDYANPRLIGKIIMDKMVLRKSLDWLGHLGLAKKSGTYTVYPQIDSSCSFNDQPLDFGVIVLFLYKATRMGLPSIVFRRTGAMKFTLVHVTSNPNRSHSLFLLHLTLKRSYRFPDVALSFHRILPHLFHREWYACSWCFLRHLLSHRNLVTEVVQAQSASRCTARIEVISSSGWVVHWWGTVSKPVKR